MTEETVRRREVLKHTGMAGIAMTGFGGAASSRVSATGGSFQDVTMTIASAFEPGNILVDAAESFKEQIEEESDGSFAVEVSPGAAFGSEDEIGELVRAGGVEAHTAGTFPFFQFAPRWFFFGNPFVMDSFDQLIRLTESEAFQPAFDQLIENGNQRPLGQQIFRGQRHFTSNSPIQSPEDVQGLNLRLPELDTWVTIWEQIGVSPTPVALDELFSALDTGVADASEGPVEQIFAFNLFEVQSHYSLTAHLIETGNLYMNEDFFQGLDETFQELALDVGETITAEASETAQNRVDERLAELEEEGMEIVEDVDREAFREAGEPAVQQVWEDSDWALSLEEVQNI